MKIGIALALVLRAGFVGRGTGGGADTKAKDEADIRALEGRFVAAFKAKDVNAIMACYVPDQSMVVFDAGHRGSLTGRRAIRRIGKIIWRPFLVRGTRR